MPQYDGTLGRKSRARATYDFEGEHREVFSLFFVVKKSIELVAGATQFIAIAEPGEMKLCLCR